MLAELFHEELDFEERHVVAAGNVDDEVAGTLEKRSLVQQRALHRAVERFDRTVLTFCLTEAEEAARVVVLERGE